MDTRRLYSFVKIVDAGSITRAADILHIAQPALSQQVSTLETQFKQQLLIRSKRGVAPTEAGRALYRHAQLILRQLELAQAAVDVSGRAPAGSVSVGLAPYSTGAALALPLLRAVRERYPDILLHINENFGGVISEAIMTGRMDMAFIYGAGPLRGVQFEPMRTEDLYLIGAPGTAASALPGDDVSITELADVGLLLPSRIHTIRQVVDAAFRHASLEPRVVGEIESVLTLTSAIGAGLGATVLPWSAAQAILDVRKLVVRRITDPAIEVKLSLCTSDHQPLSEPALAVHDLFHELIRDFDGDEVRQK
ncbi:MULTISPECIES: nitrogen assimilation transcriptional regulator NAC [unclassified Streptomyces]|uniref:nitrogen assimilation transcriptional regulator NAC n=1 Tax=unclassified Streptomyces TaxID=2593676 RepID=UPI002DD8FA36|nr:nitrogen assimilation transcriptional regulator NAC [Streptomyces sp. NBC_00243]WRZ18219.1 nitrogen assimilation transcriptional regulator NAC [Streptomyces sp. NBC_00243]